MGAYDERGVKLMQVGDKVWYTIPQNKIIYEGTVAKIGRQYFYVSRSANDRDPYKVDKQTMRDHSNYGWGYRCQVYLTKQEILDEREFTSLWENSQVFFSQWANKSKVSLEVLREVAKLLKTDGEIE